MALKVPAQESPRHGIKFREVPTKRAGMYGGSFVPYRAQSYGAILDCVFEMADMIMQSNAVSADAAISTVLKDEGWPLLPSHRKVIQEML